MRITYKLKTYPTANQQYEQAQHNSRPFERNAVTQTLPAAAFYDRRLTGTIMAIAWIVLIAAQCHTYARKITRLLPGHHHILPGPRLGNPLNWSNWSGTSRCLCHEIYIVLYRSLNAYANYLKEYLSVAGRSEE